MIKRVLAARERLKIANRFTKNYVQVLYGFAFYKLFKKGVIHGKYSHIPFVYRSCDVEAMKEVLVEEEYGFASEYLKGIQCPQIVDLGHHIGTFSLWALSVNSGCKIFGIEADLKTFRIAQKNIEISKKENRTWRILNRAAWRNEEIVSFSATGHNNMGHKVSDNGMLQVQGITIEKILESVDYKVDLMKIDIEGAEESFLAGKENVLKNVNAVIIEIHPSSCSEEVVRSTLNMSFDNVVQINREHPKPLLWCTRKSAS